MKKLALLCLLVVLSFCSQAQIDSVFRYNAGISFIHAADSIINLSVGDGGSDSSEESPTLSLTEWELFMGNRVANSIPYGADRTLIPRRVF